MGLQMLDVQSLFFFICGRGKIFNFFDETAFLVFLKYKWNFSLVTRNNATFAKPPEQNGDKMNGQPMYNNKRVNIDH